METSETVKPAEAPRPSRLATSSLVLGICAVLSDVAGLLLGKKGYHAVGGVGQFAVGCGLLAFILGAIALICIQTSPGKLWGRGRARVGIVLGSASIIMVMLYIFVMLSVTPP
jgi:uncharacterized membrane protein